jgi:outer membrane protein assembly factor BamB
MAAVAWLPLACGADNDATAAGSAGGAGTGGAETSGGPGGRDGAGPSGDVPPPSPLDAPADVHAPPADGQPAIDPRDASPPDRAADTASPDRPSPDTAAYPDGPPAMDTAPADRPADLAPDRPPIDVAQPPPLADDCGAASGLQAGAPWPTQGRCSTRRGASSVVSVHDPVELWTYPLAQGDYLATDLSISRDGTIYFSVAGSTSRTTRVQALGFDGQPKWSITGAQPQHAPTIAADGTLLFAHNLAFRAVNPDGTDKWRYPLAVQVICEAVGHDGTIYLGHYDGSLTALTANGELRFTKTLDGGYEVRGLAVTDDGTLIVGLATRTLALRPDGTQRWSQPAALAGTTPAVAPDGSILVPSDKQVIVLAPDDGAVRRTLPLGSSVYEPLAIADDGTAYGSDADFRLWAFAPGGQRLWTQWTANHGSWAPVIGGDGTVYHSAGDGTLLAMAPDGAVKWALHRRTGHLAIGADGTLYTGNATSVVALGCPANGCGACRPHCGGRTCGPDGCGGTCGSCGAGRQCQLSLGTCVSTTGVTDACGDMRGFQAGASWPLSRGCQSHSARAHNAGPAASPTPAWSYNAGSRIGSEPAIAVDGTIYVGDWTGALHAVRGDGTRAWILPGRAGSITPAIGIDGTIYAHGTDGGTHAIAPDGTVLWSVFSPFASWSMPSIGPDGTVYASLRGYLTDGLLAAFDPHLGVLRWAVATKAGPSSPLFADGQVLIFSNDDMQWRSAADGAPLSTTSRIGLGVPMWPVRAPDGSIYATDGYTIRAFRPDGVERWHVMIDPDLQLLGPALGIDGSVVVTTRLASQFGGDCGVVALDPADGKQRWRVHNLIPLDLPPVVDAAGRIYAAGVTTYPKVPGPVWGFDKDGNKLWEANLGSTVVVPPAIAGDGALILGTEDGHVVALKQGP